MTEVEFSRTREKVADAIISLLQEEGPKTTAEIREDLYPDFKDSYETPRSFHRTLGYIRDDMVKNGDIETERVEGKGSRMTWKWEAV